MKNHYLYVSCAWMGTIGSMISNAFGGWDASLTTLLIFMAIDFVTGIVVAAVFHKSKKSESGRAESKASFKGLCRKCMVLLFVLIGARLDLIIGASYIRDGICIAFMVNELLSITENAALMGVPLPSVLMNAIEVLKAKEPKEAKENTKENTKEDAIEENEG